MSEPRPQLISVTARDREALRDAYRRATPFPHVVIDGFLDPGFARAVAAAYPEASAAARIGKTFRALNERGKTQITDPAQFPKPVQELNTQLSSRDWLETIGFVTGISKLVADPELVGGGMHLMAPGALLDVHVDFNLLEERALHRRLNILVFLNEDWRPGWGGGLELWDAGVKRCVRRFEPKLNRCVVFETSEISYHGVQGLSCPPDRRRLSFAAYYYTNEPPPNWNGLRHTTVFRARPDERLKRLLMPIVGAGRTLTRSVRRVARIGAARAHVAADSRESERDRERE